MTPLWCAAKDYPVSGSSCANLTHASNCYSDGYSIDLAFGDAAGSISSLRRAKRILQLAVHDRVKSIMAAVRWPTLSMHPWAPFPRGSRNRSCPSETINLRSPHREVIHVARSQPDGPPSQASGQAP